MLTRLVGVGLICIGILFGVLFVYMPIRDGGAGFMGRMRVNALVFVPLCIVTGFAFVFGGPRALAAFQAKPKSKGQFAFVMSIIIGSGVLSGLSYWQIKSRWMREPEQVILTVPPMPTMPKQPTFVPPAIPQPPSR